MTSRSLVAPGMTVMRSFEGIELFDAAVAAHADNLVAAIQSALHHVLPELPGSPNDANLPHVRKLTLGRRAAPPRASGIRAGVGQDLRQRHPGHDLRVW